MGKLHTTHNPAFFATSTPQLAYFLGFFWGDGYLYENPKGGGTTTSIEILGEDMAALFPHFSGACKWAQIAIQKKLSTNEFVRIYSGDRDFRQVLLAFGLGDKTHSHFPALNRLDRSHWRYFFRGLLDSDGSIARYKGNCLISFASSFDQDWSALESFCAENAVKPKILRRDIVGKSDQKRRRFSLFQISKKMEFLAFLNVIYDGAAKDGIYLPRKYRQFLEIQRRLALGIGGSVKNRRDDTFALDTAPNTDTVT